MLNLGKKKKKHKYILFTDILRLATGSLSANRLRSSLTIMGITIGVFSVVGTMTALTAMRNSIDSELAFMGANVFNISRFPSVMVGGDGWWNYIHRPEITYRVARRFQDLMAEEGIDVCMSDSRGGIRVNFGDRRTSANQVVIGSNEYCLKAFNYTLATGRNISGDDLIFNRSVVVIGHQPAELLFPDRDPLGEQIYIQGHRFTVVGVLAQKGDLFGQNMDNRLMIPMTRFLSDIYSHHRSIDLSVLAPSPELIPATQDIAIGHMRLVRGLDPEDPNDFNIDSNDSLQESFGKIANIIGSAGLVISTIALITAGVGIMNIMLVSVTERTREIGIRKSIGARGTDVLKQFLIEAVFLSEIGALAGIVLGMLVGNGVAAYVHVEPVFPWNWAMIAIFVCSAIGVGFGLYPAWKAARLDPVEALRFE
ncbi:MAG: ABC transporter permease [Opitutales bacterium]|nr:ABC transporter permease [Opitutales bacterium]